VIDELAIYNRVVTATEITDHYNASKPAPDAIPPVRSNGAPTGTLAAGTTQTSLSLVTDENATCRHSQTANTAYASMTNTFTTTGGSSHSTMVSGLSNGQSYTYYVRCQDGAGNANTSDYSVSFTVASGGGGGGSGTAQWQTAYNTWVSNMTTYGRQWCEPINDVYYDAERIYFQIADFTGDTYFSNTCAQRAEVVYRDNYVLAVSCYGGVVGCVPGYWNFTHGLTMDYFRTGDATSRYAAIQLSYNAMYARDTALSESAGFQYSREVAYAIESYINAESLGEPRRTRLEQLFEQALGHLDQWFVSRTATWIQPFMVGLTAEALIMYYNQVSQDPRILTMLTTAADYLWANVWDNGSQSFFYSDRAYTWQGNSGDRTPAPDLNNLIAPLYAWIYLKTGNTSYRDKADTIFIGGVNGAAVYWNGKIFNQNYRWTFDYLRWRQGQP
jgi:hypothetical protein